MGGSFSLSCMLECHACGRRDVSVRVCVCFVRVISGGDSGVVGVVGGVNVCAS